MLIRDLMTREVVTVPPNMPVAEARKLMKVKNISRLPVVDKGRLVGIVNEDRLESIAHEHSHAPVAWQMVYVLSHTTVHDVMVKDVATIYENATVEQAVTIARKYKVGGIVVVDHEGKPVGIATTTDLFNGIAAKLLGIGEPGSRITVRNIGPSKNMSKVIDIVASQGIKIASLFTNRPPVIPARQDLILHLEIEDAAPAIKALKDAGFEADIRAR
jgi:acetoin utilization protein AcuB